MTKIWTVCALLALTAGTLLAEDRYVSLSGHHVPPFTNWWASATNIQSCLNEAVSGDRVNVAPGTYMGQGNVNLDFLGKAIKLVSTDGAEATIIDVEGVLESRAFFFHSAEPTNAVLDGFTMRRGFAYYWDFGGGAISFRYGACPTIQNCVFDLNDSFTWGGGISAGDSGTFPLVQNCTFSNCHSGWSGTAVTSINGGSIRLRNCLIADNHTQQLIAASNSSRIIIESCTIANNEGVALVSYSDDSPIAVTNTIIWGNSSSLNAPLRIQASNCCIQNLPVELSGFGNISDDPEFAGASAGDYRLASGSPCINAGVIQPWMMGAKDFDGNRRIRGARVDIGAYEAESPTEAVLACAISDGESVRSALSLDGNGDWASIARPVGDSFTIETWIRLKSPGVLGDQVYTSTPIFDCKYEHGTEDFALALDGLYPLFWMQSGPGSTRLESSLPLSLDAWNHLVVVRDRSASTSVLYVNGITADTGDANFDTLDSQSTLWIGRGHWLAHTESDKWLDADLDECRFWNRALSYGEIQSNMYNRLSGTEPGLVAYYNFDDGTAHDATASENHATLLGNASVEAITDKVTQTHTNTFLRLDGVDDYALLYNPIGAGESITVAMWARLVEEGRTGQPWYLSGPLMDAKNRTAVGDWGLMMDGLQPVLGLGADTPAVTSSVPVVLNRWFHIAGTRNIEDGIANIYVNGKSAGTNQTTDLQWHRQWQLNIGRGHADQNDYLGMDVDEVAIWNRALSQDEIRSNLFSMASGSDTGLVTYLDFDDGTANDASPTFNDAVLCNGASIAQAVATNCSFHSVNVTFVPIDGYTNYQVQFSTNLLAGDWRNLGNPVIALGGTTGKVDSVAGMRQKFYRVKGLPAGVTEIPSDGLIAYYPFNGNANDYSPNANHAVVAGGISYVPGRYGLGATNDSTGSIRAPFHPSLNVSNITISLWVNLRTYPPIEGGYVMVGRISTYQGWVLEVYGTGRLDWLLATTGAGAWDIGINPADQITLGSWHHVVSTFDQVKGGELWVDGNRWGSDTVFTGGPIATSNPLELGCAEPGNPLHTVDGVIDDVRIYGRALSVDEIQSLYYLSP